MRKVRLSDKAFAILKSHKKAGMSYSDVVLAMRFSNETKRTKTKDDLIRWIDSLPKSKSKRKTNLSQHIDEICYGVKRPKKIL